MKDILFTILQRSKDLIFNGSFNIINFNALIFLCFITYKFYAGLSFDIGLLSLIIPFLISFVLSNFVLNKFKYSENIYIRFSQKFLIYNIIFIIATGFTIYLLFLF
jgi:hypothetical protein